MWTSELVMSLMLQCVARVTTEQPPAPCALQVNTMTPMDRQPVLSVPPTWAEPLYLLIQIQKRLQQIVKVRR